MVLTKMSGCKPNPPDPLGLVQKGAQPEGTQAVQKQIAVCSARPWDPLFLSLPVAEQGLKRMGRWDRLTDRIVFPMHSRTIHHLTAQQATKVSF